MFSLDYERCVMPWFSNISPKMNSSRRLRPSLTVVIGFLSEFIVDVYGMHFGDKVTNVTHHDWLQRDLMSATLCVWMRTKSPGLQLNYKQKMECDGRRSLQLLLENAMLSTSLHRGQWFVSIIIKYYHS